MPNKTFNTRVTLKHDIEENWLKAVNFTPLAGEVIVYDPDVNNQYARIKIGNGESNVNALPFVNNVNNVQQGDGDTITILCGGPEFEKGE